MLCQVPDEAPEDLRAMALFSGSGGHQDQMYRRTIKMQVYIHSNESICVEEPQPIVQRFVLTEVPEDGLVDCPQKPFFWWGDTTPPAEGVFPPTECEL